MNSSFRIKERIREIAAIAVFDFLSITFCLHLETVLGALQRNQKEKAKETKGKSKGKQK